MDEVLTVFGSYLEKLKWTFAYQLRGALGMGACAICKLICFYTVELYTINSHNRILKDHAKGFKTVWILSHETWQFFSSIFKMSEYPPRNGRSGSPPLDSLGYQMPSIDIV